MNEEELFRLVELSRRPLNDPERQIELTDEVFWNFLREWILHCLTSDSEPFINISNWIFPINKHFYLFKVLRDIEQMRGLVNRRSRTIVLDKPLIADNTQFSGGLIFEEIIFDKQVSFNNASFGKSKSDKKQIYYEFSRCEFREGCDFSQARFHQTVSFQDCTFNGKVDFQSAKLCNSILGFNWSVNFSTKKGLLGEFNFKQLEFIGNSVVSISDLDFTENSRINIFGPNVNKHKRQFPSNRGGAERSPFEFYSVISTIKKPVVFLTHLKNNESLHPIVDFHFCNFEENTVKVRDSEMQTINLSTMNYRGFTFENCIWKPGKPPRFHTLKVSCDGDDPNKKREKEEYHQIEEKYASLKIAAKNSGDEQLASEFHFWQLFYAGKQLSKPIPKIINSLYYHVCGYGLSITRPILFWALFIFAFALIYSIILQPFKFQLPHLLCYMECNLLAFCCYLKTDPITFIIQSIQNISHDGIKLSMEASTYAFDPFKLLENSPYKNTHKEIVIGFIYFFQKAIQLFLLFEFGAAIRNKVKR